jgi:hypothetical protein
MKCKCGAEATLRTPDYGYGYGAEYLCTNGWRAHGNNEHRFLVEPNAETARDSASAFASSRANADTYRSKR